MEKEAILNATRSLPEIPADKYPIEDHEIFEGNDYGAHFKITRNFLPLPGGGRISYWTLSVSGPNKAKEKVIEDFKEALGKPTNRGPEPGGYVDPNIEFVVWLISHA